MQGLNQGVRDVFSISPFLGSEGRLLLKQEETNLVAKIYPECASLSRQFRLTGDSLYGAAEYKQASKFRPQIEIISLETLGLPARDQLSERY
jgi:hypothetical protein